MTDYPYDFGTGYKVQTVFANKTEDGIYGDIYDFRSDVKREHPGAEILTGYCVIDVGLGLVPNGCNDWNNSIAEAIKDYEEHVVPILERHQKALSNFERKKNTQAVACNGVPIFDGHGGILTTDDAARLEEMWEKSENYKSNHSSISNNSSKVSLDQQIDSASTRAADTQSVNKEAVKKPYPER